MLREYSIRRDKKPFSSPYPDNELIAYIIIGILSYFAQQEAVRISERKAGLQRLKKQGEILGRSDGFEQWKEKLMVIKQQGYLQGRMQRETGLAYNTVKSYLKRIDSKSQ